MDGLNDLIGCNSRFIFTATTVNNYVGELNYFGVGELHISNFVSCFLFD